ncbi:MAG TPA: RNA polymerase sigma factor [Polyangiaceae bacterium]|nr:RNA polymerase sigma factor [Polyangiaceae bacterium]
MSDGHASAAPAAPSPEPPTVAQPEDVEIVNALARGEPRRALALCVERHGTSIGRLCMAMLGSQGDADDVTQETLLSAHQSFGEYRGVGSVRAWLLGIARNKCLQQLEKVRRQGAKVAAAAGEARASSIDEALGVKARAERARALLDKVRPSDREALLLRFSADLSFKEIAAVSGIDEATARKRVSRALTRLRSALGSKHDDE